MAEHSETYSNITALQDQIVQLVVAKAPDDTWVEMVVNFEIEGECGGETTDWMIFAVCKEASGFKKHSLFFEFEDEDLFLELRQLYGKVNDLWSTVGITILRNGRFNFDFEYGPPKCLNGDSEAMRRFENYLDGYEQKHMNDLRSAE